MANVSRDTLPVPPALSVTGTSSPAVPPAGAAVTTYSPLGIPPYLGLLSGAARTNKADMPYHSIFYYMRAKRVDNDIYIHWVVGGQPDPNGTANGTTQTTNLTDIVIEKIVTQ